MPKYTIKKGYEHVVISQEGVRRIDASTVESDHELINPILTLVVEQPVATVTPPATPAVEAPVAPPANPTPVVNPQPTTQTQEGVK